MFSAIFCTARKNTISSILLCLVFTATPALSHAQVVISEIMYDLAEGSDSGREWVEVFNSGSTAVNLTEWKLFENGTNHGIAAYTGGDSLPAGAYAVLADTPAKFLIDWPSYSGLLFDSAFSLSNTGEALALRCCGSDLVDKDTISYVSISGGAGDGNSLYRVSVSETIFSAAAPTPGSGALVGASGTASPGATSTPGSSSEAVSSYVPPWSPVVFAYAGENRVVTVGADVELTGHASNKQGEPIEDSVRFSWSFGDGGSAEGTSVLHHWSHPGRYAVVLTIAEHTNAASDTVIIEAKPAKLVVSIIEDGSIAVQNKSGRDLDVSNWILSAWQNSFVLPTKTILLSDATVVFSPHITGLKMLIGDIALLYPNGTIAAKVGDSMSEDSPADSAPKIQTAVPTHAAPSLVVAEEESKELASISLETKVAGGEVSNATSSQLATPGVLGSYPWWIGAALISLLGVGTVYALRKTKEGDPERQANGAEWKIIEESVEPE